MNCSSGYWEVYIPEEKKKKTTFVTHQGMYQFTKMTFGLCNAPTTFKRAINIIIAKVKWNICLVYMDDIIIFSSNPKDNI